MIFYYGSETVPDCGETVTWIVNTRPHVITQTQVDDLKALLSTKVVTDGGNYRNIQPLNDRAVYRFNNLDN